MNKTGIRRLFFGVSFFVMKLLPDPPRTIRVRPDVAEPSLSDRKAAGYVRLLSAILDEPAESLALNLRAKLQVISVLSETSTSRDSAA